MNKTQLIQIETSSLVLANWNYKSDGSEKEIDKLCKSIKEDSSVGVLAVREKDGKFEVIDGNHRLKAIQKLGWDKVPCENFGEISLAKAIIIARRRNHKWFEDDILKYAEIFVENVLEEYAIEDLVEFMPDTEEEMLALQKLLDHDWGQYDDSGFDPDQEQANNKIVFELSESVFNNWQQWVDDCKKKHKVETGESCFEIAIIEAMKTIEQKSDEKQ